MIVVFHNLSQRFEYGGNRITYKNKQLEKLGTNFTPSYLKGAMIFLDDWEATLGKLRRLLHKDKNGDIFMDNDMIITLFTKAFQDKDTAIIIHQATDSTKTWDQFSDSIRTKLARRSNYDHDVSINLTQLAMAQANNVSINSASMDQLNQEIFICNLAEHRNWNVPPRIWATLPQETKTIIIDVRRQIVNSQSSSQRGKIDPRQARNNRVTPEQGSHLRNVSSILPTPPAQPEVQANQANILQNDTIINSQQNESLQVCPTETADTILQHMANSIIVTPPLYDNAADNIQSLANHTRCRVHLEYFTMMTKYKLKGQNIADGGVDTNVYGANWIRLFDVTENTPKADVFGFDSTVAIKKNLPMGPRATKTRDTMGRAIIILGPTGVGNITLPHTLFSTFVARDHGLIVDDCHEIHYKSINEKGTQTITFDDGTTIDLLCRSALMSFESTIPTLQEVNTLPSYEIISEHWNPKEHSGDHNSLFDDNGLAINNINLSDDTSITVNNIIHDDQ